MRSSGSGFNSMASNLAMSSKGLTQDQLEKGFKAFQAHEARDAMYKAAPSWSIISGAGWATWRIVSPCFCSHGIRHITDIGALISASLRHVLQSFSLRLRVTGQRAS